MNKTLLQIISAREDISDYLFHFTKGSYAKETLDKIMQDNAIIDVGNRGYLCFTEAPLTLLQETFRIFNEYHNPMYAPYGVAIKKDYLFNLGARPVIYGTKDESNEISKKLKWRFEEYSPNVRDYSWLREWRLKEKQIKLDSTNSYIITQHIDELDSALFHDENIVDVEFEWSMEDGRRCGDATGIFKRTFRGISFEDLEKIKTLSKADLDKIINEQGFDDTIEKGLGAYYS